MPVVCGAESSDNDASASVTFNQHIAPLVYEHCAPCHREGLVAPFPLVSYEDVRKRGKQIVEVTESGYMPPWLPEPGHGDFVGERRLSEDERRALREWVDQGAQEGEENPDLVVPSWAEGWQGAAPDLVARLERPYTLKVEGSDVYRNFVIRPELSESRNVGQLQFRPLNPKVVHHALIYVDTTRQSRRRDDADPESGFGGMRAPTSAFMPEGQFLSWQPGTRYDLDSGEIPWKIEPGTDLVLQVHMNPTGKEELFQCEVGFYFSETPAKEVPFKIKLTSYAIDIRAGETDYRVRDSFVLPADVRLTRILPHAHYLCRRMEGAAFLPDGTRQPLLLIEDWDFFWQGDYTYKEPIALPKGSRIEMDFSYDNSAANPLNPHSPPKRVTYGPESSDEMAELWFQALMEYPQDLPVLQRAFAQKSQQTLIDFGESSLGQRTDDPDLLMMVAQSKLAQNQLQEAFNAYRRVLQQDGNRYNAWFNTGTILRQVGQLDGAIRSFEAVIRIDPNDAEAHGSLGVALLQKGDLDRAEASFREAVRLNPKDAFAQRALQEIEANR